MTLSPKKMALIFGQETSSYKFSWKTPIGFKKNIVQYPPTEFLCKIDQHHLLIFLSLFPLNEEYAQAAAVALGCGCLWLDVLDLWCSKALSM